MLAAKLLDGVGGIAAGNDGHVRVVNDLVDDLFQPKGLSTSFSCRRLAGEIKRTVTPIDDLAISQRFRLHGLLQQTVEQETPSARGAAVEPECKLVKVVIEMLVAHSSLMSSQQPPLQERSDAMDAGQSNMRRVSGTGEHDLLSRVAVLRKAVIAFPAIRENGRARGNNVLNEPHQAGRRNIRHPLQTHPTKALGLMNFHCHRDHGLLLGEARDAVLGQAPAPGQIGLGCPKCRSKSIRIDHYADLRADDLRALQAAGWDV